jgi:Winged helix DNA-binding domain
VVRAQIELRLHSKPGMKGNGGLSSQGPVCLSIEGLVRDAPSVILRSAYRFSPRMGGVAWAQRRPGGQAWSEKIRDATLGHTLGSVPVIGNQSLILEKGSWREEEIRIAEVKPAGGSGMSRSRLHLTRAQILRFRLHAGGLDQRLPPGRRSLRRAAWAGLQDSMPRAALLSIHARVDKTASSTWDDPSLVQLWGPRYQLYVVAAEDLPIFSLGRLPDDSRARSLAEDLAARLRTFLNGRTMTYGEAGRGLGEDPNRLRYAATTGTVLIRWEGARLPTIWTIPEPEVGARKARLELARRYLHLFGPATPESFAKWAGIAHRGGVEAFEGLGRSLTAVRTPLGDASILTRDEPAFRADTGRVTDARLLPSGDSYFLLWGKDRELLVPNDDHRAALWTSRVWPGAVLVEGEIVGTWRRAHEKMTIQMWRRPTRSTRDAIEAEAASLPLPGLEAPIVVGWNV